MKDPQASMQIASSRGTYDVLFHFAVEEAAESIDRTVPYHCIVDARVQSLHRAALAKLTGGAASVIEIEATEDAKSLENLALVRRLAENGVKRNHLLVAIGGWNCPGHDVLRRDDHVPRHGLGAAADHAACAGRFLHRVQELDQRRRHQESGRHLFPPKRVVIATEFLDTLELRELQSGVGEMLKVHIVDGPRSFDRIDAAYDAIFADRAVMLAFIRASLEIKKRLIEIDEFDRGPRNLMNYGHSFGHAIEAATEFAVPHGIAVTIGADMANYVAVRLGRMSEDRFRHMHRC